MMNTIASINQHNSLSTIGSLNLNAIIFYASWFLKSDFLDWCDSWAWNLFKEKSVGLAWSDGLFIPNFPSLAEA